MTTPKLPTTTPTRNTHPKHPPYVRIPHILNSKQHFQIFIKPAGGISNMCRATQNLQSKPSLLLSSSSFHCYDDKGEKGPLPPSKTSALLTVVFIVLFLFAFEHSIRALITTFLSDYDPVMELERHRHILARHIAVDGFSCGICAFVGFQNRHELKHLLTLERNDNFHKRIHGYHPGGQQVLLFFFAYQVKNMYDTIVWEDGVLFIFHHILAGATAWFGMYPGVGSLYAIFFMGISEIPTSILCLLANFDPELGIIGLEEAFPMSRLALATSFVVTFIICRILLWPLFTYHFHHDAKQALKKEGENGRPLVKFAVKLILYCCYGLSALQLVFLGEIIVTAKKEIAQFL